MTPDQVQLLRRLALNESSAVAAVMGGLVNGDDPLDARTDSLIRLAILLSVDSDQATVQWAVEMGIAAGVDDGDVFRMLVVIAPLIGTARLTSSLPRLLEAYDIDLIDD